MKSKKDCAIQKMESKKFKDALNDLNIALTNMRDIVGYFNFNFSGTMVVYGELPQV